MLKRDKQADHLAHDICEAIRQLAALRKDKADDLLAIARTIEAVTGIERRATNGSKPEG